MSSSSAFNLPGGEPPASEKSLAHQLGGDVASAFLSAAPAAAFVCMIDQAVTQNAAKTATIGESVKQSFRTMFTSPAKYFGGRAYLAVLGVYSLTYIAANTTMTWCERTGRRPDGFKLATTSATNIAAGVTKDTMFAIWFGDPSKPRITPLSFPVTSWALFVLRDVMTIGAGFVFPARVSEFVHSRGLIESKAVADVVTQLTVPSVCQVVLTPTHLLALDVYNRPGESVANRSQYVRTVLAESALARSVRVLCVYGIAGNFNRFFRSRLRP